MGQSVSSTLVTSLIIILVAYGVGVGLIRVGPTPPEAAARVPRVEPLAVPMVSAAADTEGDWPAPANRRSVQTVFVAQRPPLGATDESHASRTEVGAFAQATWPSARGGIPQTAALAEPTPFAAASAPRELADPARILGIASANPAPLPTADRSAATAPVTTGASTTPLVAMNGTVNPAAAMAPAPRGTPATATGNVTGPESAAGPSRGTAAALSSSPSQPIRPVEHVVAANDPDPQVRPDDRIETRVVWLYFFRDANKVAQIINHNLDTYRRLTVNGATQALDVAQREADARTVERKLLAEQFAAADQAWRDAVVAAGGTIQPASASAAGTGAAATSTTPTATNPTIQRTREARDRLAGQLQAAAQTEQASLRRVRDLASVATDPGFGVHIPADDKATDPLRRVAINVVGEGILQLRGPIRGINIIRTLISQLDSPTGQVRVALHVLQVNGSTPQRIDPVAAEIQGVVDHARFVMLQSTLLLRQAITKVAARRAALAGSEHDRYLATYFSLPFLAELRRFDSTLLRSEHRLLGLHAMDATNLPTAILLLALAQADVREEILAEFRRTLQDELPAREQRFLEVSLAARGDKHHSSATLLSPAATFQTFFALVEGEECSPDTLTPVQLEVVRLAQVLKSQQYVEAELRQRVHQRLMWEEMRQHHDQQRRAAASGSVVPSSFPAPVFPQGEPNWAAGKADYTRQLDLIIHDLEEKYIDLLEGARAHTASVDGYLQQVLRALEDDLSVQCLQPAFSRIRSLGRHRGVSVGSIETTSVLANNRGIARVYPQAVAELNLPQREVIAVETLQAAEALADEAVNAASDPSFRALVLMASGQPAPVALAQSALPEGTTSAPLGSRLSGLVPPPARYQFQVGTGFEIRPVIQPDGQSVVFRLFYEHHLDLEEPEKSKKNAPEAFGRIRRHLIDTDVRLQTFELREISRYQVALRAERAGKGVPLLEDIPAVGKLFQPGISKGTLLQQNLILGEAAIYPTLYDLMGLRMARAIGDLDAETLRTADEQLRNRQDRLRQHVIETIDHTVDNFFGLPTDSSPPLLVPFAEP